MILVIGLLILSDKMDLKKSYAKRHQFYETGKDCDVIVFGSSLVINGIFPMELWKDYGISAYNFGGHGETIAINYWNLVNALEYSNPKLVIVDVAKCNIDAKCFADKLPLLHNSIDSMPLSMVKLKALRDLVSGHEIEFIFPFMLYHSRWEEIIHNSEYPEYNYAYGSEKRIGVNPMDKPKMIGAMYSGEENTSMVYLRKIAELCKAKNIELLFINMPYAGNDQMATNYVGKIAAEYKVAYYNIFIDSLDILDYKSDFYDEEHLNSQGAEKVTNLLGEYLKGSFELPNRSDDIIMKSVYDNYISNTETE